ncbi:ER membrane protein complex subunit 1 [Frankliniella fusca]|uniref:ER membrane protein complex subunit 1 n=1 Tax=Frankliniella fusca TaxID=407009 RepID=A0AAE1HT83_9NEOP|nr:ER membrane protein complex subunit 1 [Frankliniella fusca]
MDEAASCRESESCHENVNGHKILLRLKSIGKSVCSEYSIEKDLSSIVLSPTVHVLVANLFLLLLSFLCSFTVGALISSGVCCIISYNMIWDIRKGHHRTCFIPWNCIKDIYIVEAISLHRVLYNIVVLIEDEVKGSTSSHTSLKLIPLFQGTKPRLSCLETIYQSIHALLRNESGTCGERSKNMSIDSSKFILTVSHCLYEDQVGKFDWHQNYVGDVKFAFGDASGKRGIVATALNVVAALNLKTGNILWRHVLERDGSISFMSITSGGEALVILEGDKTLVRAFDPVTGALSWEWTAPSSLPVDRVSWAVSTDKLYAVLLNDGVGFAVQQFNIRTGAVISKWQSSAPWVQNERQVSNKLLFCSILYPVKSLDKPGVFVDFGSSNTVKSSQVVIFSEQSNVACKAVSSSAQWVINDLSQKSYVLLQFLVKNDELHIITSDCLSGTTLQNSPISVPWPSSLEPELKTVICGSNKDDLSSCRLLLHTSDEAVTLLQHTGKVLWVREEALASVVATEMMDLPVSDKDAAIEKEFDSKEAGVLGMFGRRLVSQALQLQHLMQSVFGLDEPHQPSGQRADLVRDDFGLHKMIVVATKAGKLFGLDNFNGEIVWQKMILNVDTTALQLFVQRTTRHAPYPAQCSLLLKDKVTKESVLYTFNPITGLGSRKNLGYRALQTMLLPVLDAESLRPIVLLDSSEKVHIEPREAISLADSFASSLYMYVADPATGIVRGYTFAQSTSERLIAARVWEVVFQPESQTLVNVVGKNPQERVHSQGRVLGDRSVLYKYVNPNLVAVVTQGTDSLHKFVLNVYLLDAVSGAIVFSISHKRAREPIHLVHTENWVVYTYFSEKWRRTEIASIELYEGKTQSNSGSFSSLIAAPQPLVERQSYILPAVVQAMKPTVTEKGITSRHVLVGLASGAVLELPWMFLDPRRPVTVTPEMREEGVIPYMPELPIPPESIINYNKSLPLISGIHTAPSGLESTSLVLVYGLDLFYTRVAPSKTFDLLKEDFDPFLISMVLIGLGLASYTTKRLASRKALKQAWK